MLCLTEGALEETQLITIYPRCATTMTHACFWVSRVFTKTIENYVACRKRCLISPRYTDTLKCELGSFHLERILTHLIGEYLSVGLHLSALNPLLTPFQESDRGKPLYPTPEPRRAEASFLHPLPSSHLPVHRTTQPQASRSSSFQTPSSLLC